MRLRLGIYEVLSVPLIYILVALVLVGIVAWLTRTYVPVPQNARRVVNVVLGLIVVGMLLWLVNAYIPMAGSIKGLLNIVVLVACCVWVLQAFGLWGQLVRLWRDLTHHRRTPPERI
jgi:hypothetical protein